MVLDGTNGAVVRAAQQMPLDATLHVVVGRVAVQAVLIDDGNLLMKAFAGVLITHKRSVHKRREKLQVWLEFSSRLRGTAAMGKTEMNEIRPKYSHSWV